MDKMKYIGLSVRYQDQLSDALIDAYLSSNLKGAQYDRLAALQGIIAKVDSLLGEVKTLANKHEIEESEMRNIIMERFSILLKGFMSKK